MQLNVTLEHRDAKDYVSRTVLSRSTAARITFLAA